MTFLNIALSSDDKYIADLLLCCNNYKIDIQFKIDQFDKYDIVIIDDSIFNLNIENNIIKPVIYIGNSKISENIVQVKKPFRFLYLIEIIEKLKENLSNYVQNSYIILDKLKKILKIKSQDENIILTSKEADFVEFLLSNSKTTKKILLKDIWHYNVEDTHTIETLVYRLRQKLKKNSDLIQTTDCGYKLKDENL